MTAFFELLQTYAIFFYIAGVIVVLFGIKMLFDARRAGRTTLFTLEQEQASDRAFRAVLVMLGATVLIGAIAGINAFVAPAVPTPEPDQVSPTAIPFTPPVFIASATPQPTLTLAPATTAPVTVRPTQQGGATATPAPVVPRTPTPPAVITPVAPPTVAPTPTSGLIYPVPPLNTPPDGDSIGANNIRFSWGYNQAAGAYDVPEILPPDQFYRVVISYNSSSQGKQQSITVCLHETSADRKTGIDLTDYRSDAVDGNFTWNVVIVRSTSQQACESGQGSPLSPASETHGFKLP
jgi:hypothetical protein